MRSNSHVYRAVSSVYFNACCRVHVGLFFKVVSFALGANNRNSTRWLSLESNLPEGREIKPELGALVATGVARFVYQLKCDTAGLYA